MYLSDRPKGSATGITTWSPAAHRVARTVVLLGVVSLLTDVSSEATGPSCRSTSRRCSA